MCIRDSTHTHTQQQQQQQQQPGQLQLPHALNNGPSNIGNASPFGQQIHQQNQPNPSIGNFRPQGAFNGGPKQVFQPQNQAPQNPLSNQEPQNVEGQYV